MITLEQLVEELDINQIDEVIASGGWDWWSTPNGTSGRPGASDTTNTNAKHFEAGWLY